MKKFGAIMLAVLMVLILSACAAAEQVPAAGALPAPEATEVPRPSAQELSVLKSGLEWTEEPSFANFQAVTLDGRVVNQELFASHKLNMVNIWATYCNPCIMEMPDLAQLNQTYEEGEFQVIGLVVDMLDTDRSVHPLGVEAAWMIIDATGANYTHMLPVDDLIRAKIQYLTGVPETVFVDSRGNIVNPDTPYIGARDYDGWKAIVDGLMAELSAEAASAEPMN